MIELKHRIKKRFQLMIDAQIERRNKNIKQALHSRALMTTAEYIEEHLPFVQSVTSKEALYDIALKEITIDGLMLEFGVYSGQSLNYFARKKPNAQFYGFDSFEGLPENWYSSFPKGTFSMETLPAVEPNVELIKGWFHETLPKFKQKHVGKIAFLHIDCDLYSSTKIIFQMLSSQISSGAIILFDEYFNYPSWKRGEFLAFQEFCETQSVGYTYLSYNELHEQVLVRIENQ